MTMKRPRAESRSIGFFRGPAVMTGRAGKTEGTDEIFQSRKIKKTGEDLD